MNIGPIDQERSWLKAVTIALFVLIAIIAHTNIARADILFQNVQTGAIQDWALNGVQQSGNTALPNPGSSEWKIVGSGDFTGDTLPDLLLQSTSTGQLVYWAMSGTQLRSWGYINPTNPGVGWKVVAVADLNRDGHPDIIFQNQNTGDLVYWLMNGFNLIRWGYLVYPGSASWTVVGTGDFNRDGNQDLLLQDRQSGTLVYWEMNGTSLVSWSNLSPNSPGAQWRVVGVGDLNNDGFPDVVFQNTFSGQLAYWLLNGVTEISAGNIQPTTPGAGWSAVLVWTPQSIRPF